jgi:plastocyanin
LVPARRPWHPTLAEGRTADHIRGHLAVDAVLKWLPGFRASYIDTITSPACGLDETFRIVGMTNPAITVPAGSHVSIQVINADPDTSHGLVITVGGGKPSWMPMMTASPAFPGAALWFLGNPTTAGMHAGTLSFTAAAAGSYHYLCPVPGHAQEGMTGTFVVTGTR